MIRRPPRLTRTDTLFPYTPRFRSGDDRSLEAVGERDGAVAEDFGAGDMEDVGCEGLDVPLDAWRDHQRRAIFAAPGNRERSEEHTSELQSLMRISYAVFCLKKTKK